MFARNRFALRVPEREKTFRRVDLDDFAAFHEHDTVGILARKGQWGVRSFTTGAETMNLDSAGSNLEAAAPGLPGKRVLDFRIVEFTDLAAGLADFEGGDPWVDLAML